MKSLQYYFTAQHPNEKIVRIVHRHWFNMFIQFIPVIVMLSLMIFSFIFYPTISSNFPTQAAHATFLFAQSLIVLMMWMYGFLIWFDYYLDTWIVTTHRIVNVDQKGLFSRSVGELEFSRIQDIITDVHGFFPTILNYGNLTVQTAAEQSHFLFKSVGNPYAIKTLIMEQVKKSKHKKPPRKKPGDGL